MRGIVIGKRITIGAAMLATSEGIQVMFPEYASVIGSFTISVIFIVQLIVVNAWGVTTK